MRQNDAQIGKIMSTELKFHQYKQMMTFPDSEINSNAASTLDKLALKKSSSNEVFEHIQKELAADMETGDFQSRNNDCFESTLTELNISMQRC